MTKHTILFLAANPPGTDRLTLDKEARAIRVALERSGHRDRFELETRWAAQPLDLLDELRKLRPTVVHFGGHGGRGELRVGTGPRRDVVDELDGDHSTDNGNHQHGLFFQGPDGRPRLVAAAALEETFGAAGASVRLVVLNACYSEVQAEALLAHVDCVIGMGGSIHDDAARSFAAGFYGGLGERQSVAAAYKQGRAAISAEGLPDSEKPQLRVRTGFDATKVVLAVEKVTRPLLQMSAPVAETISCPYPGMREFAEADADRFFGRDEEIDDLVGRLDRGKREIYVIGPSGSGKSSLVRAGLLHLLKAGTSRLERSFLLRTMRPGERPTDRLAKLLEGDLGTPAAAIAELVTLHPPAERLLVFIDQLEELFTLADAAERRRFIAVLRALRGVSQCHLVLALRADFYGALMDSELWPDKAGIARLDVAPLRRAALAEAITAPAQRVGVRLEVRLCDRLVADAATEPGALPLVQETLRLLWDRRRRQSIGLQEYEALGAGRPGLDVAIARLAGTTLDALTAMQQTIARRVLLRLMSFGEGRADTRRQQSVRALRSASDDPAEVSRVLQRLVEDRLVTLDGDEGADGALVDLSHEALITSWPAFQDWLAPRRADEQQRRRLETKAREWVERGRRTAGLLDPVELSEVEQWMRSDAARELGFGLELLELVAASRNELKNAQRQRRQQTFRTFAALAMISVAALAFGLLAFEQRQAAQRKLRAERFLDQGQVLLDEHPMRALPYLVAARETGMEGAVIRASFVQALRSVPLVTFVGHTSGVTVTAFSADGTRVVTASSDKTARVWDAMTGKPVTEPLRHQGPVVAAAFSANGARVVTASEDKTARIWDAMTGKLLTVPLEHQSGVVAAAFSPDSTRVVTVSDDRTARVWDATTGKPVTEPVQHQGRGTVAALSTDGTRVVTIDDDNTARVWDAATGRPVTAPLQHQGPVLTAAFSADGTRVVTTSDDKTARVWDATTGEPVTASLQHQDRVTGATLSADGTRVVTTSEDRTAQVWDATTGKLVTAPLEHQNRVAAAAFSVDGRRIVTASGDETVRVWDTTTGRPVTSPLEHARLVQPAAFSPDGVRVITASNDGTARVWDATAREPVIVPLETRRRVITAAFSVDRMRMVTASADSTAQIWDVTTGQPATPPLNHQGRILVIAFNADSTRVLTANGDKTARLWDLTTGQPVTPPLEHRGRVTTAALSADGRRIVTGSLDKTVQVWDAATGKPVTPPLAHQGIVRSVAFSADGTKIITASGDSTARVWDARTGEPVTPPLAYWGLVRTATFSPDGTRVITASDQTARVWDAATGKPVTALLRHRGLVETAAFSPDGTRVITASRDKTARVWNATTGKPVTAPLELQGSVKTVAFSPDGTQVVTASNEGTVRVWDATTGKPVTAPLEHPGGVMAVAFSTDGTRVITASSANTVRVWPLWMYVDSLEDWRLLARCSPFVLMNDDLRANPDPARTCRHPPENNATR